MKFANRPISPHLTVYFPQFSSLFSIWHRISGVILTVFVFSFLVLLKLHTFVTLFHYTVFFDLNIVWILRFIEFSLFFIVFYHLLNGLRHIVWDFGVFLSVSKLHATSLLLIGFLVLFLFLALKFYL